MPELSGQLSSVAIRRAVDEDSAEMNRVASAARLAVSDRWLANENNIYNGSGTYTYLSEDENPFGFVTSGNPVEEYFRDGLTGEILSLFIHPDYWGFGFGKKLLVHGLTVLKRREFETAILWIPDIADRAIAISLGLNFRPIEGAQLTDYKTGGLEQACYKLDLTAYF